MWSPSGCRTAPLPVAHELKASDLCWNPKGDALLLFDKDRFCVSFLTLPSDGTEDASTASTGDPATAAQPDDQPVATVASSGRAEIHLP